MQASDLMSAPVVTVTPEHNVRHAADIMAQWGFSGLPVVGAAGELVGIITEGDLLRRKELDYRSRQDHSSPAASDFVHVHSWRVGDVMTRACITVGESATVPEVARLFIENGIKRVPVLRGKQLVGIVSRADLMRVIAANQPERFPPGDEAIRRAVRARISTAIAGGLGDIDVMVADAIVHLRGTVPTQVERDAARVAAEEVPSVGRVVDHLLIQSPPSGQAATS